MRIEDVYDLNELNVKKFVKYCKARPEDDEKDLIPVYAYVDEDGNIDPRTKLFFSRKRYAQQENRIWSMLGQLQAIHHRLGYPDKLDLLDLQYKYDGIRWTEDPNCTLFLFWLGNAGKYFKGLKKDPDGIYRTDLHRCEKYIWDWESPSDPNLQKRFQEWDSLKSRCDIGDPEDLRCLFTRFGATRETKNLAAIQSAIKSGDIEI